MSGRAELPFERFRYWQGQMVRARDFRDQLAEGERQAEWHNRSVHSAFGVRFGFDVTVVQGGTPRVQIACGVAFDCSGAMLTLQRPRGVRLPPFDPDATETAVLLVRSREGGCSCGCQEETAASGVDRLWEDDLVFTWMKIYRGNPEAGVPLARIGRGTFGEVTIDRSVRLLARPVARPRIGSGATIPGLTPWEPWAFGMQTRIDTSAAGFTQIPGYFAVLFATREPVPAKTALPFLFRTHVADPGLTEFTFRTTAASRRSTVDVVELTRTYGLAVCWLGCQALEFLPPACPGQMPAPEPCETSDEPPDPQASGSCGNCEASPDLQVGRAEI
jgi:hypothetical protein